MFSLRQSTSLLSLLMFGLVAAHGAPARSADAGPEQRRVFFGELHLHTTYSSDAWSIVGTKATPDDGYKFARGDVIEYLGHKVQRAWPLDFAAVTDHSEFMGVLNQLDDPNSVLSKSAYGKKLAASPKFATKEIFDARAQRKVPPELNAPAAMADTWEREMAAANANYQPGKFTTFIAYEWSSMPEDKYNLHRNVIFRTDRAPMPFSAVDSIKPEDLWTYLEKARRDGYEAIAIPHNSNASGGLMFDWNTSDGRPIDQVYAQRRALNEPLVEMYQSKGQSETVPALSSADEFAEFEIQPYILTAAVPSKVDGSYVRQAYGRGLILQNKVGVNPYKMGLVGGTDYHNALSTTDENAYVGFTGVGGVDPRTDIPDLEKTKIDLGITPIAATVDREADAKGAKTSSKLDATVYGSGGLTGVWAEENTRDSIFAALKRKETYATSGPPMRVRVFGGWDFKPDMLKQKDWVKAAYATGVPMGGDMPARPAGKASPHFVIQALKAPTSANLDRVQVIKVWLDGANYQEKIFDVALSNGRHVDPHTGKAPPVGNTVDLKSATYTNTIGATELSTVWEDPTFNPAQAAVYYVRVLEIPTPRWTAILAAKYQLPVPTDRSPILQERAWASPIWYTPVGADKK
jgi:hypothetical protein